MEPDARSEAAPLAAVSGLLEATNAHDPDAVAACFAVDYVNETPAHPLRGFSGRDQVHTNWAHIFSAVPDLGTRLLGTAVNGRGKAGGERTTAAGTPPSTAKERAPLTYGPSG